VGARQFSYVREINTVFPSAKPPMKNLCQSTRTGLPVGGALSVRHRSDAAGARRRGGRPERERRMPVNMENQLHCDNGEGAALRPPPYPLDSAARVFPG